MPNSASNKLPTPSQSLLQQITPVAQQQQQQQAK